MKQVTSAWGGPFAELALVSALALLAPVGLSAQDQVEIVPTRLDNGVYMLVGQGGNLVV